MPTLRTISLLMVVVLASQSAAVAAFRLRADPDPQKTRARLARLLNESPSGGTVLTIAQCDALPVAFLTASTDAACGTVQKWGSWPTPEGYCQSGFSMGTTKADAETTCHAAHANAKMFAPATDAERCTVTHWNAFGGGQYSAYWWLTGMTDEATEGVWLGPDGEAIDPAYLNWATAPVQQPDGGTAENCVAYKNNEAHDVACNAVPASNWAVCHVRVPAA